MWVRVVASVYIVVIIARMDVRDCVMCLTAIVDTWTLGGAVLYVNYTACI